MKDIVAGTIGGMTTVVVGHPLDTVKVRLQTSTSHYSSMADCIVKTWRVEGIRGYYKGVQSPLAGEAFFNAVQFLAYGQSKAVIGRWRGEGGVEGGEAPPPLSVSDYFLAGGMTGAASCLVECPVDLLKSQLQTVIYRPNPPFTSFTSAVSYVLRHRGVVGLYQGLFPTFARTIPSTAAYFGCYEWTRSALSGRLGLDGREESEVEVSAVILIAGGVGGFAYWLSTYPADVVKSAVQSDDIFPDRRRYRGTRDCVQQLWAEGGWRRFYRGLAPCLIRSIPANAACFWAYEYVRTLRTHPCIQRTLHLQLARSPLTVPASPSPSIVSLVRPCTPPSSRPSALSVCRRVGDKWDAQSDHGSGCRTARLPV